MSRTGKLRQVVGPGILMVSSVALTFFILELIFPSFLLWLPLKTHWYLDEGIHVLPQYSKKATIPEHYIALVGDSYAAGQGDWFFTGNQNSYWPAYHSAHVIHERTGKDVISFGSSGGGSLRGLVSDPVSQYALINASLCFSIPPPDLILVYFYEGNDLNNNLEDIELRFMTGYDQQRIYDEDYFTDFIRNTVHRQDPVYRRAQDMNLWDNLLFSRFILRMTKSVVAEKLQALVSGQQTEMEPAEGINQVLVNGEPVTIPDGLQSPALELSDDEITLAVHVFERSLAYLQEFFPTARIGVVYIPSPLASYRIASRKVSIETYQGRGHIYDSDLVSVRNRLISARIAQAAKDREVAFMDATTYLLKASAHEIIHGPMDWKHFNKKGYLALAEAVLALLETMADHSRSFQGV